jgi:hypothetical protein
MRVNETGSVQDIGDETDVQTPPKAATTWRPLRSKSEDDYRFASTIAFCIFATVNVLAGMYAPIQDCDEVFNYWEPTHYLNHGFGLQTWEYSPEYAIRSWLYIALHAVPGKLGALFLWKRHNEFYLVRILLALICAGAETRLFHAISRAINFKIAIIFTIAMVTTPGMFYASVAYLPSSFAMYTSMMGLAAFIDTKSGSGTSQGIMWFGIGATVGWPFAAALLLPLFTDELTHLWLTGRVREIADRVLGGAVRTLTIVVRRSSQIICRSDTADRSSHCKSSLIYSSITKSCSCLGVSYRTTFSVARPVGLIFSAQSHGISISAICC